MPAEGRGAEVLRPAALKAVNPATMKLPGVINTLHLELFFCNKVIAQRIPSADAD